MDHFLNAARNFGAGSSSSSKDFLENLLKYAEQLSRSTWVNLDNGVSALGQSGDRGYALGTLGLLTSKSKHADFNNNFDTFVNQFNVFLTTLQEADINLIRLSPGLMGEIVQNMATAYIKKKIAMKGINLAITALRKVQSSPRQLTSVHAPLLELCLSSSTLNAALPFLIDDIDDFSSDLKGSECKPILLYFYYGGMIFAALKKYSEAIYFFEACIRVPAVTLSHIMLEAYKKFVLLSLIQHGEIPQPPKCASQLINRILKPSSAPPYCDLIITFASHNPNDLNNLISRNLEVYRRDGNYGLIKQLKKAQTKLNIQRLTKTFLTLSLADVASRVQLQGGAKQAEDYILSMIQDGEIYAKINQRDGMVVFLDNKEKYNNPRMMQKIANQITKCVELNKRLAEMNEKLSTNPDYISKVVLAAEDEGISSSKIPTFSM